MGRRRCCCEGACWYFGDDFNRLAVTTNLGPNWEEVTGDWWIDYDVLLHPGADEEDTGVVMCRRGVPANSAGEMRVEVEIVDPVVGGEYFVYVGCTDYLVESTGEWAKYTYNGSNSFDIELSTGEMKTCAWPPVYPGRFPVVVCLDSDGFLMATLASSGDEFPWSVLATASGRYSGLGHSALPDDADCVFDNFLVEELRDDDKPQLCHMCFCHCAGKHVPKELKLEIVDGTGRASCMSGAASMYWEWNSGAYRWVADEIGVTNGAGGADIPFRWVLGCGAYDPEHPFTHLPLTFHPDLKYRTCCVSNTPDGCNTIFYPDPTVSSCNPLYLRYGPFKLAIGDLACNACEQAGMGTSTGTYYIEITEA